jgi:hypothetical protein
MRGPENGFHGLVIGGAGIGISNQKSQGAAQGKAFIHARKPFNGI